MTHPRRTTSLLAAAALGLTLTGPLAACGGDEKPTAAPSVPASKPFNDADVDFATGMIPHHAMALSMVDLTRGRPTDPAFRRLAQGILDTQAPEIQTMAGWLQDWDEPVPETMRDHAHADEHGATGGDADLEELADTPDADFQDAWLRAMIAHHEDAVAMARTEASRGEYAAARALARTIADGQADEVDAMRAMLDS